MFSRRKGYPPEFRHQIVELARAGRPVISIAEEFEVSVKSVYRWVHQADLDEGRRSDGLTSVERDELRHLRRENRQLREERAILAKAAAWFARRSESMTSSGS